MLGGFPSWCDMAAADRAVCQLAGGGELHCKEGDHSRPEGRFEPLKVAQRCHPCPASHTPVSDRQTSAAADGDHRNHTNWCMQLHVYEWIECQILYHTPVFAQHSHSPWAVASLFCGSGSVSLIARCSSSHSKSGVLIHGQQCDFALLANAHSWCLGCCQQHHDKKYESAARWPLAPLGLPGAAIKGPNRVGYLDQGARNTQAGTVTKGKLMLC